MFVTYAYGGLQMALGEGLEIGNKRYGLHEQKQ